MNPDRVTYFAATDARGQRVPFGIKAKDRPRHMYVIGKTGMGKSTLLENMAIQDIQNGEGMAFIDPHGSAVESLLDYIPPHRINDVVYFAPFDMEHPIAFNVMEDVGYDKRHLVTSGLMATFKKIWQDAWSARMEYILTNTLLALLEYPDATLLGVNRMYTDKAYRTKVIENVKDPVVKDFWTKEFANYTDRFTQEATPAIQNKVGQFTSNPLIRNIIGQPKSSFDIRELMDSRKILLVNLSKGLVGDVNMRLLGSMITTRIFLGAMSRADLPPQELKKAPPFYFYVDEFQNFANETFAEILSEARKYNLNLIMAHQYVEQMEEEVRNAVFGNVGTTVAYRVGPFDAEVLETVFSPEFMKEDLVNLGQYQMYLTLMIDGVGSRPFSAVGIPPIEPPPVSLKQQAIDQSRRQFAAPRATVEAAVFSELMPPEPERKPPADDGPRRPAGEGEVRRDGPRRPGRPERQDRPASQPELRGRQGRVRHDQPPPGTRLERQRDQKRPRDAGTQRERPTPPQEGKSLGDLRDILRDMTAQIEVAKPPPRDTAPLKDALTQVSSQPALTPQPKAPTQLPRNREERKPDVNRRSDRQGDSSAAERPAPVETRPGSAPEVPDQRSSGPYEVPEETLRALFREP